MEGTYFIQNVEFENYMQLDDGGGNIFELWDFDGEKDQRWELIYVSNGYYKIQSVSTGKVATSPDDLNNPVWQDDYNGRDNQLWKITDAGNGQYKFSPKKYPSYYMAAGDAPLEFVTNGRNVELRANRSDGKDEWYIQKGNVYLEFSYDLGFIERNRVASESNDTVRSTIEQNIEDDYFSAIYKAFSEKCNIYFMFSSVQNYTSDADNCPNSGINQICECIPNSYCRLSSSHAEEDNNNQHGFDCWCHCKSMVRLRNNLIVDIPDNTIRITYTGHTTCCYDESDGHVSNVIGLSDFSEPIISMNVSQNNGSKSNRDQSILVLAHELSHTYGAVHHAARSTPCIMGDGRYAGINPDNPDTYWCDECIRIIKSHNNRY